MRTIAVFNHKGGVGKTTSCFNLSWALAEMGKTVVMVDADPQCNLTGLAIDMSQGGDLDQFYTNNPEQNIYSALLPAFESRPEPIVPVPCVDVAGRPNLKLLPGHVNLTEYEAPLALAQELAVGLSVFKNLPGATHHLLTNIAEAENADYIIVDMSPSLNSWNQNLLVTSDFFIVPTGVDYFSLMALKSLTSMLPRWIDWGTSAHALLKTAAYPFPQPNTRFLGTIVQTFSHTQKRKATASSQKRIRAVNALLPALTEVNAVLDEGLYTSLNIGNHPLGEVPDFGTLVALSQENQTPVFALDDRQLNAAGVVLEQQKEKRAEFRKIFSDLADRVDGLVTNA